MCVSVCVSICVRASACILGETSFTQAAVILHAMVDFAYFISVCARARVCVCVCVCGKANENTSSDITPLYSVMIIA